MSEELQQEGNSESVVTVEPVGPELGLHLEEVARFQEHFGPQLKEAGLTIVFNSTITALTGLTSNRFRNWSLANEFAEIRREDGTLVAVVTRDPSDYASKPEPILLIDRPEIHGEGRNTPHEFYLSSDTEAPSTHYHFAVTPDTDVEVSFGEPVLNRVLRLFGSTSSPAQGSQEVSGRS
jgi:hypothetical protein